MTTRSLRLIGQDVRQCLFGHVAGSRLLGHAVAGPLELGRVQAVEPVIFFQRQQDGYVTILPPDDHRLALCLVEHRPQASRGLACRNESPPGLRCLIRIRIDWPFLNDRPPARCAPTYPARVSFSTPPASPPHRPPHRLRLPLNHLEEHPRSTGRAAFALFPFAHRPGAHAEGGGELVL